ncbi:LVIVD repeat-containing protein [Terrimonas alba]|uniref:LVIVD repeat-containing protein n=1 Tax=Terrimonas alba TaxID=3349636 RepID=UPI0035F407F1
MNKRLTVEIASFLLMGFTLLFTACVKDSCKETHTYTYFEPVYKAKEEVKANIKSNASKEIEKPGKIYTLGNYIFLNEVDRGIHVIDNSNPSNPVNISFIDIPGNMDLAVKGNMLYADMYGDLVTIDITDPRSVKLTKAIEGIFPERMWGNGFRGSGDIVVDWIRKDTTVTESCERQNWLFEGRGDVFFSASKANAAVSASPVGVGGSMARFTIVNDYMYTVDMHNLKCISISNAADPVLKNNVNAGFDIETIFPFKNTLFVGSMGGMYIFDITNPESPVAKSTFVHSRACDPVIADDKYAYVTLRAGTTCGPSANELQVIDIKDLASPSLVKSYPLSGPYGLAKDEDLLFICDGTAGLKAYNAADVQNLQLKKTISGIDTYDVIAMNKIALVVAKDGLYQYDYSNVSDIKLLSKIVIEKK